MRQFLSKSIAGGLSAGVVLLWWPVLFANVDSVTSWLVRGALWTVLFELLLVTLAPIEEALWQTHRGERIAGRFGAAQTRLHSGSSRRRLGRLGALATVALALPVALLVMGLQAQTPARADSAPRPLTKVVHVTKVVKVRKVVRAAPVVSRIEAGPAPGAAAPVRSGAPETPAKSRAVVDREPPAKSESAPAAAPEVTTAPDATGGGEDDGGTTAPAASPSL